MLDLTHSPGSAGKTRFHTAGICRWRSTPPSMSAARGFAALPSSSEEMDPSDAGAPPDWGNALPYRQGLQPAHFRQRHPRGHRLHLGAVGYPGQRLDDRRPGPGPAFRRSAGRPRPRASRGWSLPTASPGSVGGGVFMNAGAYGGELRDAVLWVECLDSDGELRRLAGTALQFGYRGASLPATPTVHPPGGLRAPLGAAGADRGEDAGTAGPPPGKTAGRPVQRRLDLQAPRGGLRRDAD